MFNFPRIIIDFVLMKNAPMLSLGNDYTAMGVRHLDMFT